MGPIIRFRDVAHHTPTSWSCHGVSCISCGLVAEQTRLLLMLTYKYKWNHALPVANVTSRISSPAGSNCVFEPSAVFNTLDVVPFFQLMRWCYRLGTQVQMLLQRSTRAAIRDAVCCAGLRTFRLRTRRFYRLKCRCTVTFGSPVYNKDACNHTHAHKL
jgi:hypothetical protein